MQRDRLLTRYAVSFDTNDDYNGNSATRWFKSGKEAAAFALGQTCYGSIATFTDHKIGTAQARRLGVV